MVALYGVAFGVLAATQGLSALEAALFSALVNAGGAQLASLQVWAEPIPLLAVVLTTLAMNARYLLLGATLRPWMGGLPHYQTYPSLFVMGDGNWALTLREREAGRADAAFLVGSGAAMWAIWIASTTIGHGFGQLLDDPRAYGIDFMLAAFFAAMIVPFLRSGSDIVPLLVGIGTAIAVDQLAAGPWSILAGALGGSLAGAIRPDADAA